MRQDDWELKINIDGQPLKEYAIAGHTVVAAQPGKTFVVTANYRGSKQHVYFIKLLIDGKETGAWVSIDPTGTTARGRSWTFPGWLKSAGKDYVYSDFIFDGAQMDTENANACSFVVGGTKWECGVVELQVEKAKLEIADRDIPWPSVDYDADPACPLPERELVKGGLSASVGNGDTLFKSHKSNIMVHAGEAMVVEVKGQAVLSYQLHYRDDFFLALHDHVNLPKLQGVDASKGRSKHTVRRIKNLREQMERIQQTTAKLKRRQKGCGPATIDLTCYDGE